MLEPFNAVGHWDGRNRRSGRKSENKAEKNFTFYVLYFNSTHFQNCGAVMAGEIESQNIVGYKQIDVAAGTMVGMGVQFNDTATENTIAVKDLLSIPAAEQKGANGLTAGADQIWVWDVANTAWKYYFFRKQGTRVIGWCKQGETAVTADTLNDGDGFFFKRPTGTGATVTLNGAVNCTDLSVPVTVAAGTMTFMTYPWPIQYAIADFVNNIPTAEQKGANGLTAGADQIWVWDDVNTAWKYYFFRKQGTRVIGWCKQGETDVTEDTIDPGTCFFFKRPTGTGTTITFTKPAGL